MREPAIAVLGVSAIIMFAAYSNRYRHAAVATLLLWALASNALAQGDTITVSNAAASRQLLSQAEQQLAAGHAEAAYTLLGPREDDFAGNAYFDYLLGVAALDSGRTTQAIFSLQRAIAVAPQFAGARMELARAYFESGSVAEARSLFVSLLDESPPAAVSDVLNQYIAAIDARPATPASRFSPYLEFGSGYDSNANGSTDNQQFLGFTLTPNNVETESPFADLAAGFSYSRPSSTRFGWYNGLRASYRSNPDADFVDSGIASGYGGFNWRRERFFGRLGADAYWASRDGESNEKWVAGDLLLGRRLSDRWDLTLNLRSGALRHRNSIEILDVDRTLATLGFAYRPTPSSVINLSIIGGKDDERVSGAPYGNDKRGARLSFRAPFGRAFVFGSIGSLESDYDGLFFNGQRKDTQNNVLLQFEFRDVWSDGLSLIPRLRYINTDSDIALYEYDRTEVGLSLRWTPQ